MVIGSLSGEESSLVRISRVRTILIVEHDPYQPESFIQRVSFKAHHLVKLATNAEAALQFVKHIKPSLFLVAHHLPAIDGLALYDLLQESRGLASTPATSLGFCCPNRRWQSSRRSNSYC